MAKKLLEAYANRLRVSESVYGQTHNGQKMSNLKKMTVAACLDNVSRFMNEAFDSSAATQRSDMGNWKRFCLNLTTVALPNLIAFDLVMVNPMTSMTGYVAYVQYLAGTKKGAIDPADEDSALFNSPFKLGNVDPDYTSDRVVEPVVSFTSGTTKVAWFPVVTGSIRALDADGNEVSDNETTPWTASDDGTITAGAYKDGKSATDVAKIAYVYDNVVIPQKAGLPTIKAEIKSIPLLAKARRIAVYYSQIAAFQAKTDYGFDLGDQLAEKAVGQLSYEIDTEIVELLDSVAKETTTLTDLAELTWSKTLPVGVNKRDHYAGFAEIMEIAKQKIYDRTKRFAPNYMIIASDILPVLSFMDGFTAAPTSSINGPYYAGTANGLKIFVSPAMDKGDFVIGVNGDDLMSSVAVYAPYLPVIPTQLLQFADGATSQGFSTMYDLKVLNEALIVKGKIAE